MLIDRLAELIGINRKPEVTVQDIEAGEIKSRQLVADYMEGRMSLEDFRTETEKLPKLDLRKLAQELHL